MAKVKMDYKKITVDDMVQYVLKYDNTKEAKDFLKSFYEKKAKKYKLVLKLDEDGNPIRYIGKDGKEKFRKEKQAIGSDKTEVYNVLKAKKGFYERYKDDIEFEQPPVKTKEQEKDKVAKALSLLG